jgi:hypothetical protein
MRFTAPIVKINGVNEGDTKMTVAMVDGVETDISERLLVAVEVIQRLGKYRALEAGSPNVSPIPNPLGEGFTGVDLDGATYRARIGVANALDGTQVRITLGRTRNPNEAAYMYRVAHVALYGSYSWAVGSLCDSERSLIKMTSAVLNG